MKIITPPFINDLEGLLELMVDPKKGIAYLQQMKAMKDAIDASLETLKTKEQADEALALARQKLDAAIDKVAEAEVAQREIHHEVAQEMDDLAAAKDAFEADRSRRSAELDARQRDLDAYAEKVGLQVRDLSQQEADLRKREANLKDGQAQLAAAQAAWAKKVAALKDAGLA